MGHHSFDYQGVDLTRIFIGRDKELDLFNIYLTRWKKLLLNTNLQAGEAMMAAPSPNNKLSGLIVLLYGRGGFGKSKLLKRYRDMALAKEHGLLVSAIVDWEFAIEGKRALFNPAPDQQIDAHEYYRVLCTQLADALEKSPKDFKSYQGTVRDVDSARKQADIVLGRMQNDDRYTALRGLTIDTLSDLLGAVTPGFVSKIVTNAQVKDAANEGVQLGAELIAQVHAKFRADLGHKLEDYLDASTRLGLALGRDLRAFARNFPLLVLFDTYEEIDSADHLLRVVMGAAGPRVGWVLAGRDNLWAGTGQRKRSIAKEYSYKEIVPDDRSLAIDFDAGGVGAFTSSETLEYFARARALSHRKPPPPALTEAQAEQIINVTLGIPLAVSIAAAIYLETAQLEYVTTALGSRRKIVEQMIERYLLHVRDDDVDRYKLYGLALLRRQDVPRITAVAIGLSEDEAAGVYERELSRLHRRYSFVFTEKAQPSLHQEVRYFLRLWLLEHCAEPGISALSARLKDAHEALLKDLEARRQYATFQDRMQDDEWVHNYLDLAELQCWCDPVEGVRFLLPFMLAASIYRRGINKDAATLGEFFAARIPAPYRNWLAWATAGLPATTGHRYSARALDGLQNLLPLTERNILTFATFLPDSRKELEAALWWRLGEVCEHDTEALAWYEKALTRLGTQDELKVAIVKVTWNIISPLYAAQKYAECLPLLHRAIDLRPDFRLHNMRAIIYSLLKDYQRAIEDDTRSLTLDPEFVLAYTNRGNTYLYLKKYEQAIKDCKSAIDLDPKFVLAYISRGNAYVGMKEFQQAFKDFDYAVELDPKLALAYATRGDTYQTLKDYQRAIDDYTSAIQLDPNDDLHYNNRGNALSSMQEYQRAIEDYTVAIQLNPDLALAYRNRGAIHMIRKDYQRAIDDYTSAIALDPNHTRAYYNRGSAYYNLKEYQLAIKDYTSSLALNPHQALAYHNRGNAYYGLQKYQCAIKDFDHIIKLDPNQPLAYYNRGNAYYNLKDYQQAIDDYTSAIMLNPNQSPAHYYRGKAYFNLKKYQQAIDNYTCVIQLDPDQAGNYHERGIAYLWLKDAQQAAIDYHTAHSHDPTEINAAWMAEWAAMGKLRVGGEVAEHLEAIAAIKPDHYLTHVCRGVALGLQERLKEGLQEMDQAIPLNPKEWDAYFWKGMLAAYYYRGSRALSLAEQAIAQSLEIGLPPILLTPLYWLEVDRPEVFAQYARPLLLKYEV